MGSSLRHESGFELVDPVPMTSHSGSSSSVKVVMTKQGLCKLPPPTDVGCVWIAMIPITHHPFQKRNKQAKFLSETETILLFRIRSSVGV